jgi:hypothetical protein
MSRENDYWACAVPASMQDRATMIKAIALADVNFRRHASRRAKIDDVMETLADVDLNQRRLVDIRTSVAGSFMLWEQAKGTHAIFNDAIKTGTTSNEVNIWMDAHAAEWEHEL